ncbi:MAG: riboflavin biosynthesis protein RibD [Devosia sp. 67-54]|uniref:bifunctional diaminohydroxyphosphoribosylaminopyrimidine deaminase/5-amino-6-(5-phosphoribosylamino)uracil reductase RibD n=1 Tax=unclassified Devosia TaxID=196773 RepID=UPI00096905C3|nr:MULTISPECIES: bifunctional diaminohydroxyphosphoribosylaminopyrimidine deaminase/5-amino-6-(5-phosphoribosylamino)uracil reductase RibD [unclassified Devosia]MBN9306403.1 bifunctional diaminohydroxyphosphoribosylaminopyrimidine deaminase/5-amino-6-(5-phosphoribosylamino)uracil reductase RibD [Devosia sp.]OJX18458.1 MAG: riboflavin biosynthesis protein RibD [Devosia sp. 67-54]
MTDGASDRRWLDAAARLASSALGSTGAAPTVGALVVDPGRQLLFGRAATPPRGSDPAELLALSEARGMTEGRTLYVTLEPAAHYTSHAPITDAILEFGIGRVVAGMLDPDPQRAGQGLAALAEAGIEAVHLDHAPSRLLNEGYTTRITKGRPFVTLKLSLSADGMVGYAAPGSDTLLGAEALRFIERERAAADAILSGAARAEIEDNDLRIHLDGLEGRGALRVILAGARDIDLRRELFAAVSGIPIVVFTTPERPLTLRPGVEVIAVEGRHGRPDLRQVLSILGDRGINRLFVEAGARLAESFIAGELVDRLHIIDTPVELGRSGVPAALLGSFADRIAAARFSQVDRRALGEDKVRTLERR